ncbi:transposase [Lentzea nigeriaca]|nr:transposase [Lentzea nigeriaca]
MLTSWKRTEQFAFLNEVSCVPLQHALRLLCEGAGVKPFPATDSVVGIDIGLDHLVVLSSGEKIANPRHGRRDGPCLAKAQRCLPTREGKSTVEPPVFRCRTWV